MNFIWNIPTKVLFGRGSFEDLFMENMPGKKAFVVASSGKALKDAGWIDDLTQRFEDLGIESVVWDRVEKTCSVSAAEKGTDMAREAGCDFVIGIGGGSVLDTAKAISALLSCDFKGDVWDLIKGDFRIAKTGNFPCISIPTTSGTGSEVSPLSLVTNEDEAEKREFNSVFPQLAIIDPDIMITVPKRPTALLGFDMLLRAMAGYVSYSRSAPAQMLQIAVIGNTVQFLPHAVLDGENIELRDRLAYASLMSGFTASLTKRTLPEVMADALCAYYEDLPHGAGLMMVSDAYFKVLADKHVCDDRLRELTLAMGGVQGTVGNVLQKLKKACGVDGVKMSDYGVTPDKFPALVRKVASAYTEPVDMCDFTDKEIEDIYLASYR